MSATTDLARDLRRHKHYANDEVRGMCEAAAPMLDVLAAAEAVLSTIPCPNCGGYGTQEEWGLATSGGEVVASFSTTISVPCAACAENMRLRAKNVDNFYKRAELATRVVEAEERARDFEAGGGL